MNIRIESSRIAAEISELGAELKSLRDQENGREYMWSGDPAWWAGTAPILFPVIGGLYQGVYRYQKKEYSLTTHGFARQSRFSVKQRTPEHLVLILQSNNQINMSYPFDFLFEVTYSIDYSGITIGVVVENTGSHRMYFSVGYHPAFRLPYAGGILEHYYIDFELPEKSPRYFFVDGCITERTEPVLNNSTQLFLTRSLFDSGPIIFTDLRSREISIRKSKSTCKVSIHHDSPYLAIWSKPNGAPFVCIEPWHGLPDPLGYCGPIEEKPGILTLLPGERFTSRCSILVS